MATAQVWSLPRESAIQALQGTPGGASKSDAQTEKHWVERKYADAQYRGDHPWVATNELRGINDKRGLTLPDFVEEVEEPQDPPLPPVILATSNRERVDTYNTLLHRDTIAHNGANHWCWQYQPSVRYNYDGSDPTYDRTNHIPPKCRIETKVCIPASRDQTPFIFELFLMFLHSTEFQRGNVFIRAQQHRVSTTVSSQLLCTFNRSNGSANTRTSEHRSSHIIITRSHKQVYHDVISRPMCIIPAPAS